MMIKNKKLVATLAVVLVAALIGGVVAYLNDSDIHTDSITLTGSLDIELMQPAWKGEALSNVQPRQTFAKDPRVKNNSSFDVYVYMEVVVPYVEDMLVQDTTGRILNADKPGGALYTYNLGSGWTQLTEPAVSVDGEGRKLASYVYCWMQNGFLTPLKPGETTGPLFENFSVANYTHATLVGERQDLRVNAYGLDAAILQDTDPLAPKTPQAMWTLLRNTYPSPTPAPSPTPGPSASASESVGPTLSPTPVPSPAGTPAGRAES